VLDVPEDAAQHEHIDGQKIAERADCSGILASNLDRRELGALGRLLGKIGQSLIPLDKGRRAELLRDAPGSPR
jgi:hypothetical protein